LPQSPSILWLNDLEKITQIYAKEETISCKLFKKINKKHIFQISDLKAKQKLGQHEIKMPFIPTPQVQPCLYTHHRCTNSSWFSDSEHPSSTRAHSEDQPWTSGHSWNVSKALIKKKATLYDQCIPFVPCPSSSVYLNLYLVSVPQRLLKMVWVLTLSLPMACPKPCNKPFSEK
jgi:hypothetical protein